MLLLTNSSTNNIAVRIFSRLLLRVLARTPLVHDEEHAPESVQVLSNGSLQLRDVTSRDVSAFTCLVLLQNDSRLALAETFMITVRGRLYAV